mmetsp:Transcript_34841/g.81382  ORF Transcript_34841/g.81382 Transcript_34841/m.81382 type:complete len:1147 (+) Transcript_34841:82-3522(+)
MKIALLLSSLLWSAVLAEFYLDAGQCRVTECATGYVGTGEDSCSAPSDEESDPEDFLLAGCNPLCVVPETTTGYITSSCDTSSGARPVSACSLSCASGYRSSRSGPTAVCGSGFGVFTFSGCEVIPTCTLPADTTGYDISSCNTGGGTLTEARCSLVCDTLNGYGGVAADSCLSGSGVFTLSGCAPACVLPSVTTGYSTGLCTGTRTTSQCAITCAEDYIGTAVHSCEVASNPSATHSLSGCFAAPRCSLPDAHTGYIVSGCGDGQLVPVTSCLVACDSGRYTGIGVPSCAADGGIFSFTGCSLIPRCTLPPETIGYTYVGCGSSRDVAYASDCAVSCALGYTGTAIDECVTDGSSFVFSGCSVLPACQASPTAGYNLVNCDTSASEITELSCSAACAANYDGDAVDTCAQTGGAFVFSGCKPQCSLPVTMPAGYLALNCAGARLAETCVVTCDETNGYEGDPLVICESAAGTFEFSGCRAVPKCRLPSSTPGYGTLGCNPGRLNTYGIPASQCLLRCAAGFQGTATATCSADGGTMTLSGCVRNTMCSLPSATTGYLTTECATPESSCTNPLDESACTAECATGYVGTAMDTCDTAGGEFAFSGCSPMCVHPGDTTGYVTTLCNTATAAIPEVSCSLSCAAGYSATGAGPQATCSSGFGVFSFTGCELTPTCTLPASTNGYLTANCPASQRRITEAACEVTCDTAGGYGGVAADSCPSDGGSFVFTGCSPACILPTSTTGYVTTGCQGTRSSEQCTVSCSPDYIGTARDSCTTASLPSSEHILSGCTPAPKCTLPPVTTGYLHSNCASATALSCVLTCAAGYQGTPVDTCPADGQQFVFTGCTPTPQCTLPADTEGYSHSGCGSSSSTAYAADCSVSCAAGFTGTAVDTCSVEGEPFVFSGCTRIPRCSIPSTPGYDLAACDTSGGPITESACTVTCATLYSGAASRTCTADNGVFELSGCLPHCNLPVPTPVGFAAVDCSGFRLASSCDMACATGYVGVAVPTCVSGGDPFILSGCSPETRCTLPEVNPGYDTTLCNTGRGSSYGITTPECIVSCALGFTGTSAVTCAADGAEFELSGCIRRNVCTLPSSTTGYVTTQCATSTSVCGSSSDDDAVDDTFSTNAAARPYQSFFLPLTLLVHLQCR